MKISKSLILKILSFLILDAIIFIFCGLFMMGYDDFYNENQGEYFSLSSMETKYQIVWIFYNIWLGFHFLLLFYFLFILLKKLILKRV